MTPVVTGERQTLTSLEQCFTFLREQCSSQAANLPEPGEELKHEKIRAE